MANDAFIALSPCSSNALDRDWRKEILCHVSAPTESWLEFLEDQKNLAIVLSGLALRFDVDRTDFSVVLACREISSRSIVCVIKTKTGGPWRESDPPLTVCRNVGCTFFCRPIHVNGHHLAMPVQLLLHVGVIENVDRHRPSFFQTNQWAWKLAVVIRRRNNSVGSDLHWGDLYADSVISCGGLRLVSGASVCAWLKAFELGTRKAPVVAAATFRKSLRDCGTDFIDFPRWVVDRS